jgi:Glycosyltransferase sugar-binding region containing DXD motif
MSKFNRNAGLATIGECVKGCLNFLKMLNNFYRFLNKVKKFYFMAVQKFRDLMIQNPLNEESKRFFQLCEKKFNDFACQSNKVSISQPKTCLIPHIVHLIWLGPRSYPQFALDLLLEWVELNQDFEFYLWTDNQEMTEFPISKVHIKRVGIDFCLKFLKKEYDLNSSYAAKSDILRLELLYEFGGFYTDYDNRCLKNLWDLTSSCEFLGVFECEPFLNLIPDPISGEFMEPRISNCLVGTIKLNPAFPQIFEKIKEAHAFFESRTQKILTYQIVYATYTHFGLGIKDYMLSHDNRFLILPTCLGWRHVRGKRIFEIDYDPYFEINFLESVGWNGEKYDFMQFKNLFV